MSFQPTAVDEVTLTFLVDNTIEWMTKFPPGFHQEVRIHAMQNPPIDKLTGKPILDLDNYCCGAHGLAVMVSTKKGGEDHKILFDTGPEAKSISRNIASLKMPLDDLEAMALSHWHRDHSGGILEVLKEAAKPGILVDLHPSRPVARGIAPPPFNKIMLRLPEDPTFEEIKALGGEVALNNQPHTIGGGTVFISGEIPRVTDFEEGLLGSVRWVELNDPRDAIEQQENGKWVAEPEIMDERYAAIDVIGKGLIIISSCSHAGICNVLKDAVGKLKRPIYMVVGGLHLAGPELQYRVPPTVEFISETLKPAPTYVLPMHCTGFRAKVALEKALGEGCVPACTGMKVVVEGSPDSEAMLHPPTF